ncbi:IQ domain-containing protein M [Eulemur rufifrons]|uniref:IQ domain-containing protein M n=1 Tax=Eulemur rufifrons TaxID=859984 RepID=UPI003743459B
MDSAEAMPEETKCPTVEITKQNFFQEAKTLIAQHYKKTNENKIPGPSINVFKNKHQKPKSVQYIPLEIKKKETLDAVQQHRAALKNICFPKELSKGGHFVEPSRRTSFKEPHLFSIKEKYDHVEQIIKEKVKLGKIMTNIEPVSKKMEKEKQQHSGKFRMLESLHTTPVQLGWPIRPVTPSVGFHKEFDKAIYDWRGAVLTGSSRLAHDSCSLSESSSIFREYSKTLIKTEQQPIKPKPEPKPRAKSITNKGDKLDNKVKRIGPHIEIFQVFQERTKFMITKKIIRLITLMQAYVRGFLERKRLQRIMTKALHHGPNLRAVMNMYRRIIHRVRYRLGLWRTRQIINLSELEEWMDRKKFYETMFAKREDWQGIERGELLKFFNECGHFPTQKQLDDIWDLVHQDGQEKYSELIKKFHAIEMLFTLYPPQGAQVCNNTQLKSTWLRPVVNGEEGYKYIVNGHPLLKRANIRVVGKLVASSIRERKMRQYIKS